MNLDEFNRRHRENARRMGVPMEEAVARMKKATDALGFQAMQPHLEAPSEAWGQFFAFSFGKPTTVEEWRASRPRLWHLRARWQWAGRKPYEHIWTPLLDASDFASPVYTHTITPTRREPPPEGTLARAWWDVGDALGEAVHATSRELRIFAARLRRTVRGR